MFFILLLYLHSHFLFNVIPHPSVVFTPMLYFQPSPSQSDLRHFHFSTIPLIFLPRALRPWVGIFYPRAFFTLCSFTDILTCLYEGFSESRQFFLEVCRASYWFSKHRPGPSVCLTHSNPQPSCSKRFGFKFYLILSWIACGESLIYLLFTRFELFSLVQIHMQRLLKNTLNKT